MLLLSYGRYYFFSLSNNVFEIKLILCVSEKRPCLIPHGPTVPRAINKIQKNCPINMSWLIFFDILSVPPPVTIIDPDPLTAEHPRENTVTHTHAYWVSWRKWKGDWEARVLNCTRLHRLKHTGNETKDIMLVSCLLYTRSHTAKPGIIPIFISSLCPLVSRGHSLLTLRSMLLQ